MKKRQTRKNAKKSIASRYFTVKVNFKHVPMEVMDGFFKMLTEWCDKKKLTCDIFYQQGKSSIHFSSNARKKILVESDKLDIILLLRDNPLCESFSISQFMMYT